MSPPAPADTPLTIRSRRLPLAIFFVLTFCLSWGFWIPAALAAKGRLAFPVPETLAGLLGAWGPSLVAVLVTAATSGWAGLAVLLRRLTQWRVGARWLIFALLWPALLSLTVTGIATLLGSPLPDFAQPPVVSLYPVPPELLSAGFLALLPMVFVIQVFGSSLGEELGWRGFALPRLQHGMSALSASIILGLIWGVWQSARLWTPGVAFDWVAALWLVVGMVLNTILYTWLFNNTQGSLIPVILLHTTQAVTGLFLSATPNSWLTNGLTALLVIVIIGRVGADGFNRLKRDQNRTSS